MKFDINLYIICYGMPINLNIQLFLLYILLLYMDLYSSVVRITCQSVALDWFNPYKTDSGNEGIGTGFFINTNSKQKSDTNSFIITCAHVIENAVRIWITVPSHGKDKFEAELISVCFDKDIALLRILDYTFSNSYIEFGDSDTIKNGSTVTAIGYPAGQDKLKFTRGIISGRQDRYLQTDAPINHGNSGGPLMDDTNKVIGINTARISSSIADNIGFATPIYDLIVILTEMLACDGKQLREKIIYQPHLACEFNNSSIFLSTVFRLPAEFNSYGYYIKNIAVSSPLYHTGLRSGDILLSFDNMLIDNHGECIVKWNKEKVHLNHILTRYKISAQVSIKYWNSSKINNAEYTQLPSDVQIITSNVNFQVPFPYEIKEHHYPFEPIDYEIFAGLILMKLTLNHIYGSLKNKSISKEQFYYLKQYIEPVNRAISVIIISCVLPGSNISTMDIIFSGDIVEKINGKTITTLTDVRNALRNPINVDAKPYMIIKTTIGTIACISYKKIIQDEIFLSDKYKYPISKIYSFFHNLK
jgi:S1-C subfamily serine protease